MEMVGMWGDLLTYVEQTMCLCTRLAALHVLSHLINLTPEEYAPLQVRKLRLREIEELKSP